MALQKRVSELPAVTTVTGTDLLIVSSSNATKRTSVQQIGAYFQANGVAGPQGPQGPAGATGSTGAGFYWLADYVSGNGYVPGAVVRGSNGNLYIATGSGGLGDPAAGAAGWNLYVPKGTTGATGPTGATGAAGTTTWAGITDKPSTFTPTTHTHVAANITDFTSAVVAAAPPTTNASLLTSGTLPDARLSSAIARTSDITTAVANVVNAAPASLDTLKELADALGSDASFSVTVTNSLAGKVAKAGGAMNANANLTFADGTSNSEIAGFGVGVQLTASPGKYATIQYNSVQVVDGATSVHMSATGVTFADATSQSTAFTSALKTKLDGISTGATANATDAQLRDRSTHTGTQAISTVTGLQTALDGKQASGSYAATVHTHGISDVTGLQTALDGKAATSHGHAIADVTGLQTALDGKQASGSYAAASHVHGNITNAGAIGSTTGQIVVTTTGGVLTTAATISNSQVSGLGTLATQSGTFSGTSSGTNTGDQTITLTGDVTGSGTGSFAATLSNTGVTAGTFTSVTVDAKGRVTAGSSPAVAYSSLSGTPSTFAPAAHNQAWSTITSTPTTLAGYGITDAVGSSDARLTDARTPVSHTHSSSSITDFATAVAAASPEEVLEYTTAASFPATGNASLLYRATDSSRLFAWVGSQYAEVGPTSISVSGGSVTSVAGRTGAVTIAAADVSGLAAVATSGAYADLSGRPTLGTAAAAATGDFAAASHTHAASAISDSTTAGRALLTGADAAAQRTSLGLGSLATQSSVAYSSLTGTPSTFAPTAHKSTHATGGTDALTAADIGAAATSHNHAASEITSGTIATARLGSGSATSTTFLAGDQTWKTVTSGSTSASDLTAGTLANARMTTRARASMNIYLSSSFR